LKAGGVNFGLELNCTFFSLVGRTHST